MPVFEPVTRIESHVEPLVQVPSSRQEGIYEDWEIGRISEVTEAEK